MIGFKKMLLEEELRLEKILHVAEEQLRYAPEGTLRLSKSKKYPQYYHCTEAYNEISRNGKYLGVDKKELVQQLAQKSYDEKIVSFVKKRLAQIRAIAKDYEDDELEMIYQREHVERQKFIRPVVESWEKQLQNWAGEQYVSKDFREDAPLILTDRGERVRSKSEKIMADFFYRNGILYKYEHPLYLQGFGYVYPDFTFLSPKTGEEIYWEHWGKMDDPAYARKAVKKQQLYENNGIFPGDGLIVTYETEQTVLNSKTLEKLTKKYLTR